MTLLQTPRGPLAIRELSTIEEMIAAEELQRKVWGADTFPHPKELLIPVQHEGGLLAGAFTQENELIGFVLGFRTRDPGIMHSQMLATLSDWRGNGIGEHLKWFQRDWCLAQGIRLVRWTVDPLRAANAALNIRRLGGTASVYYPNYYGPMQGIDAGAPTDRLLLEWQLDSQRVAHRASGAQTDIGFPNTPEALETQNGIPCSIHLDLDAPSVLVRLPADFTGLSHTDPAMSMQWRMQSRVVLQHYFSKGFAVREFTQVGGPAYLLQQGNASDGA